MLSFFTELTGIEGTLKEPLNLSRALGFNFLRLVLEDVNELPSNELALLLGVVNTLETSKEFIASIDDSQVDTELRLKNLLDLLALVQSHAAIVHKDGVESISNGFCHQLSGNGRVDTTTDSTQHLAVRANQGANSCDFLADEFRHCPLLLGTANTHSEVLQKLSTLGRV